MIVFIPNVYFSSNLYAKKVNGGLLISPIKNKDFTEEQVSIFCQETSTSNPNPNPNPNTNSQTQNTAVLSGKVNFIKLLLMAFKQKVFLFCTLGLSSLFFIITIIQFWGPLYMKDVLKITDEYQINISFGIVCVSSPTMGVLFGGYTSSKIGGYESKHSIMLIVIFALCTTLTAIPITFVTNLIPFIIWLWIYLFFGGAILPGLTGIIISSLPPEYRGSANSLTFFVSSLLGYLPATTVYGVINENFSYNRTAMMCTMFYTLAGFLLISAAAYFRYKSFLDFPNKTDIFGNFIYEERKNSFSKHQDLGKNLQKVFGSYLDVSNDDIAAAIEPPIDNHSIPSEDSKNSKPLQLFSEKEESEHSDIELGTQNFYTSCQSSSQNSFPVNPVAINSKSNSTPQFNLNLNLNKVEQKSSNVENATNHKNVSQNLSNGGKDDSIFAQKIFDYDSQISKNGSIKETSSDNIFYKNKPV